jgi:hypothetical protein
MIAFQQNAFEGFDMASVTIYDPTSQVTLIATAPPVDQSGLVATLQAQVETLTTELAAANAQVTTVTGENTALQAKITAAQAALA